MLPLISPGDTGAPAAAAATQPWPHATTHGAAAKAAVAAAAWWGGQGRPPTRPLSAGRLSLLWLLLPPPL
jgi:hypothetical protein